MSIEFAFIRLMIRFERMKFVVSFQSVIAIFFENSFNRVTHWFSSQLRRPWSRNQSHEINFQPRAREEALKVIPRILKNFLFILILKGKVKLQKRCKVTNVSADHF